MNYRLKNIPLAIRSLIFALGTFGFLFSSEPISSDKTFLFCLKSNENLLEINRSEEGFDVDLILIKEEGFYRNELNKRVKILDLNKGNISSSFLSLARYLRNSKPSFLITSMDHLHIVAWIAKIISGSSVKLIFRMPTTATYLYNNIRLSYLGFKYLIMFLVVRILYKNYPLIVSSKEIKEEYVDFYKLNRQKVFVIPNPIDTDFIRKKSKEEINLGKLKRPSITAIGRLMHDKDFITIIDAFKLLT